MQANEQLCNAVIAGTEEIFTKQGLKISHEPPRVASAGDVDNQVIVMLSFKTDVTGTLCFKSSLKFGKRICSHLFGDEGTDNDYELLKESMAEWLNWISGGIQRAWQGEPRIDIATPSVFVWEERFEKSCCDEAATMIRFHMGSYRFSIEIMLD